MNAQATLTDELLQLAESPEPQAWIGLHSPFNFDSVDIWQATNYRLSPSNHGRYKTVWYYEQDPAALGPGQFELILDELVRMLDGRGKLVLRYTQNQHFTVILLKNWLGRRYNTSCRVVSENQNAGEFVTVFEIERHDAERYQSRTWTFAMLTQGKRLENIEAFFRSVRAFDPKHEHELLVCGPKLPELEHYGLTYHEGEYREELAEISAKKNDIAQAANNENLCIIHDRYRLNDDFIGGFESFGYDFDFLVALQWYECGTRFPAYAALTASDLSWSPPIDCSDYNSMRPIQYINGGFIIAKTRTMRDIRFNDMLFWNQAEDAELALAFRRQQLPPRVNVFSSATTMGITPEYTKAFLNEEGMIQTGPTGQPAKWIDKIKHRGKEIERRLRPYWHARKRAA